MAVATPAPRALKWASWRRATALLTIVLVALVTPVTSAHAQGDWDVERDPFDKTIVARLKSTLAKQPHDAAALSRLVSLYRKYRTLSQLTKEFADGAAGADGAAQVVLGKLARQAGDDNKAVEHFVAAAAKRPRDAKLLIDLGDLYQKRNEFPAAKATYERALAPDVVRSESDLLRVHDALIAIAVAEGDNDQAARAIARRLAIRQDTDVMLDYADLLVRQGKHEDAAKAFGDVEARLKGDPTKRLDVIGRAAAALDARGDAAGAIAAYKRAIALSPAGYYLANEYWMRIADIYRKRQELPQLVTEIEASWPAAKQSYFQAEMLARLYEEIGQPEKAIASYRKAVAKAPWELETQRRLIALLEASGRSSEALTQLEAVGKIAPGEPQVALDLAERYMKQGDSKRAFALAGAVEKRFAGDAGILASVADAYQRWGDAKRATSVYERIATIDADPLHLIALGEVYLSNGDAPRAQATWERIAAASSVPALLQAAEVMAQNGAAQRALDYVTKAEKLEPNNYLVYRTKAAVYDALKMDVEALASYKKAIDLADTKLTMERRDLRRRLVGQLTRRTQSRALELKTIAAWQTAFFSTPPNLEAGYLLALYYERRPTKGEPTTTLARLVTLAPTDTAVLDDLANALVADRRYDDAITTLLQIAEKDAAREREIYTRIAEIKSTARDDAAALSWAKKAVERSPNNPEGHKRLAERYVEMQRIDEATRSYEAAIAIAPNSPSLFDVYFALASLYLQAGNVERASSLYREVLRRAVDDEQIMQAGRSAIEVGEFTGSLGELEKTLAPLAFTMVHKPVYRQLLVSLYLRYVPVLDVQANASTPAVAARAKAELVRLAGSALTPLLDVLQDETQDALRASVIGALEQLGNRAAARALIEFAKRKPAATTQVSTSQPTSDLRVTALLAAGHLQATDAVHLLGDLLSSSDGVLRESAWFTVATQTPPAPLAALAPALRDRRPAIVVLGCLALARAADRRAMETARQLAEDASAHELVRAACVYAMGVRSEQSPQTLATFAALSQQVGEIGRIATWALSRHGAQASNRAEIVAQFWGYHHDTAAAALAAFVAPPPPMPTWELARSAGRIDAAALIKSLPGTPTPAAALQGNFSDWVSELAAAAAAILATNDDAQVGQALHLLDQADGRLSFGAPALLDGALAPGEPTLRRVVWPILWANHKHLATSELGVRVMTKACPDHLLASLLAEIVAASPAARIVAIGAIAARAPIELNEPLTKMLDELSANTDWKLRHLGAAVLSRLQAPPKEFMQRCLRDGSAYVRESCLAGLSVEGTGYLLSTIEPIARDPNPLVRAAAAQWLCKAAATGAACASLTSDPDERVRRATTLAPL